MKVRRLSRSGWSSFALAALSATVVHCSGSGRTNDVTDAGEGGMVATAGSAGTLAGTGGTTSGAAGVGGTTGSAGIGGAAAGKGGAAGGAGVAGAGAIAGGGAAGLDAGAAGVSTNGGESGSMTAGGSGGECSGGIAEDRRHGRRARSSGFSGTDAQYNELYNLPACFSIDDCVEPCLERGGTETMCFAGECVDSTEDYCLPATIWSNLSSLLVEGSDPYTDAAALVLVGTPYRDFLLIDDFKLEVPASAEIEGITVTVRRAGGGPDEAFDFAVRLLKGGVMGESDRARPTPWNAPPF